MNLLTKKQVNGLLATGNYLGTSPKFDAGDELKYRVPSYAEIGADAFERLNAPKPDEILKVLGIHRQVLLGMPVLDLVWEYKVYILPVTALTQFFHLLEPQLEAK